MECQQLRHIVASSAEAETAGLFHNAQTALPICQTLEALGHKQQPTPIPTDNSTASCFVHNNIQVKRQKHGICNTIGFVIVRHNNNSKFIGKEGSLMMLITSPNIMQQHIIEKNDETTCMIFFQTNNTLLNNFLSGATP